MLSSLSTRKGAAGHTRTVRLGRFCIVKFLRPLLFSMTYEVEPSEKFSGRPLWQHRAQRGGPGVQPLSGVFSVKRQGVAPFLRARLSFCSTSLYLALCDAQSRPRRLRLQFVNPEHQRLSHVRAAPCASQGGAAHRGGCTCAACHCATCCHPLVQLTWLPRRLCRSWPRPALQAVLQPRQGTACEGGACEAPDSGTR